MPRLIAQNEGGSHDFIDLRRQQIQHEEQYGKECPKCGKEYGRRKQVCQETDCNKCPLRVSKRKRPSDDSDVGPPTKKQRISRTEFQPSGSQTITTATTRPSSGSLYDHIPSSHPDEPIRLEARDPVFLNPNSHKTLVTILQDIGKDLQVAKYCPGSKRKWAIIVCDGLPYTLCLRVLKETYTCSECQQAVFTRSQLVAHMEEEHGALVAEEDELIREFDWALVRIGYGHYEMNMVSY